VNPNCLVFLGWWILVRSEALLYYPLPSYLGVSERNGHVDCLRVNKENLAKIREVVLLYFFRFDFFTSPVHKKCDFDSEVSLMQRLGIAGIAAYILLDPESSRACSTLCKIPVLMKGTCCQGQARNDVHDVQSTCLRENETWILTLAMSAKAPV